MFLFPGSQKMCCSEVYVKALKSAREELNLTPTADKSYMYSIPDIDD